MQKDPERIAFARRLRKEMTPEEMFFWQRIRGGQMGHRFRKQHPLGIYTVDFVCLERKLIIELDGGQHAERAESDRIRDEWLKSVGYRVMRFWNFQVKEDWDTVSDAIWNALNTIAPNEV